MLFLVQILQRFPQFAKSVSTKKQYIQLFSAIKNGNFLKPTSMRSEIFNVGSATRTKSATDATNIIFLDFSHFNLNGLRTSRLKFEKSFRLESDLQIVFFCSNVSSFFLLFILKVFVLNLSESVPRKLMVSVRACSWISVCECNGAR